MTLQVAGVGVLCGFTRLRAPNCGGERVVIHDEGGSGAECRNRVNPDRDVADCFGFEVFIDNLCIIPFL